MKQSVYITMLCAIMQKDKNIFFDWKWDTEKPFTSPAAAIGEDIRGFFELEEEDFWWKRVPKYVPVERVQDIHIMAPVEFNSNFLEFLSKKQIYLHQYSWDGNWVGSFPSRKQLAHGDILLEQVKLQSRTKKRLSLSKILIQTAFKNMKRLLGYYERRKILPANSANFSTDLMASLKLADSLNAIMGVEGAFRRNYYECLDWLTLEGMKLEGRRYAPAPNPGNALYSFLNALLYAEIASEINRTPLDAGFGMLHQYGRAQQPLVYDISEVFKPIIVDPLFLTLTRKKMIISEDFSISENGIYLKKEPKLKVVRAFNGKIHDTMYSNHFKRKVSYRSLIRADAYKFLNHLVDKTPFKPYVHEW